MAESAEAAAKGQQDMRTPLNSEPVQKVFAKKSAVPKKGHHIAILQANVEQGTVPKGLTPNIKLTAFKQNAALEVAVNMCLTDASANILRCLLSHYQEVKARSKANALKIEQNIKLQIEESEDQQTWSTLWRQSKESAEVNSQELAKTLANKRTGKWATIISDSEVHTYTNTVTKVTFITSNVSTESITKHLQCIQKSGEEMEETQQQRGTLLQRPWPRCQRPRPKRERPPKLLR